MKINWTSEQLSNNQRLIPVIVQEKGSREILMLAYVNKESFDKTLTTGKAHFYSRERKKIWKKGEQSGNEMKITDIKMDCDQDALLFEVILEGRHACHLNRKSCFINVPKSDIL